MLAGQVTKFLVQRLGTFTLQLSDTVDARADEITRNTRTDARDFFQFGFHPL